MGSEGGAQGGLAQPKDLAIAEGAWGMPRFPHMPKHGRPRSPLPVIPPSLSSPTETVSQIANLPQGCLDMDQMSAARHLGYIAPTMLKKQVGARCIRLVPLRSVGAVVFDWWSLLQGGWDTHHAQEAGGAPLRVL